MMDDVTIDRRKLRTRRALRNALLELVVTEGYDNLTVTDITEHADLRRATFYLHYKSIDELLAATLTHLMDDFVARLSEEAEQDATDPLPIPIEKDDTSETIAIFEYVAEHHTLYRALLNSHAGALVRHTIQTYLAQIKARELQALPQPLPMPIDIIANYIAGAKLTTITWWLDNDMPYTAYDMALMLQSLIHNGLQPLLQRHRE